MLHDLVTSMLHYCVLINCTQRHNMHKPQELKQSQYYYCIRLAAIAIASRQAPSDCQSRQSLYVATGEQPVAVQASPCDPADHTTL